jgi:hypothetical protein
VCSWRFGFSRFLSGSLAKFCEKNTWCVARVAARPHQLLLKNFCRFPAEIFATIFDALPPFLLRFAVRSDASIWSRATTILSVTGRHSLPSLFRDVQCFQVLRWRGDRHAVGSSDKTYCVQMYTYEGQHKSGSSSIGSRSNR